MHLLSPGWRPALQAPCPTLRMGWVAMWHPTTPAISFFHLKLQGYRLAVSCSTHTQVSPMLFCLVLPFSVSDGIWELSKFRVSREIFLVGNDKNIVRPGSAWVFSSCKVLALLGYEFSEIPLPLVNVDALSYRACRNMVQLNEVWCSKF